MIVAFHKPHGVLSQFNPNPGEPDQRNLSAFDLPASVAPLGRLDLDSEGLLLLSDEPELVDRLLHPRFRHRRLYLVQVEGLPADRDLDRLRLGGLHIRGYHTLPCRTRRLKGEPNVFPRDPPVRERRTVPDSWLVLELREGKNRQVRRMTAAIGYPTLRLIRIAIGRFRMEGLAPGEWKTLGEADRRRVLA